VREARVPVVILHRRGTSRDMQDRPRYDDVTREVFEFFADRIRALEAEGIDPEAIVVDPGIGFGKRVVDNLALIGDVDELGSLGRPVMIGASRKSFIGKLLRDAPVGERETGTLTVHAAAILGGAAAIRVHEVGPHRELVRILAAVTHPGEHLE
jgi:dihydropteroate synthase